MSALRERCDAMMVRLHRTIEREVEWNRAVDDLMGFVIAERGRAADPALEPTFCVCLYFGTAADRDEFMAIAREAKPDMITRKVP